jgi:hypothetical protein
MQKNEKTLKRIGYSKVVANVLLSLFPCSHNFYIFFNQTSTK